MRVNRRSTEILPTVEEVVRVVSANGNTALGQFLISRANTRHLRVAKLGQNIPAPFLQVIASVPVLDKTLYRAGARHHRLPFDFQGPWVDHLAWGLDSILQATRYLIAGQVFAAVVLIRTQLERWSYNVAHSHKCEQLEGETKSDFFRRAWSLYTATKSRNYDPGELFRQLSECLHGRGNLTGLIDWENIALLEGDYPLQDFDPLLQVQWLCLMQIRAAVCCLQGTPDDLLFHICDCAEVLPYQRLSFGLDPRLLWPCGFLDLELMKGNLPRSSYLQSLASPKPPSLPQTLTVEAFVHRRVQTTHVAFAGFLFESQHATSCIARMEGRRSAQIFVSELCALLMLWLPPDSKGAKALAMAGAALRSALHLWLEEDPRCLGCLRAALELTARARTWRLKPAKAQKIEDLGAKASPRDWIEAAGWRRLGILAKVFGEFAHLWKNQKWSGAHGTLEHLHPNHGNSTILDQSDHARSSARGNALDTLMRLAGLEALEWVKPVSRTIARAFEELLAPLVAAGEESERMMARIWASGIDSVSTGRGQATQHDPFEEVLLKKAQWVEDHLRLNV